MAATIYGSLLKQAAKENLQPDSRNQRDGEQVAEIAVASQNSSARSPPERSAESRSAQVRSQRRLVEIWESYK